MSIDITAIRAQISDGKHHGYVKVATADMLTMLDEIEALRAREYQLEKDMWDVMTIMQQIKIANVTNNQSAWSKWWSSATERVRQWMLNPIKYMQSPMWEDGQNVWREDKPEEI